MDGEPCPAWAGFVEHELAAVCADDLAGEAQAEAYTVDLTAARFFAAIEPFEHALAILRRNARAGVGDGEQKVVVLFAQVNGNEAAGLVVLDRVAGKVLDLIKCIKWDT